MRPKVYNIDLGANSTEYKNDHWGEHVLIQCSKESLRRFIKLFLSINPTEYWFHQTLTFNHKIINPKIAKNYLKQLLDSLEKAFPSMASFSVQGNQKKGGIHFHVIFMFFGKQQKSPEQMREDFGHEVFTRWNKIHGGKLFRRANLMTLQKKNFRCIEYLLKHVCVTDEPLGREPHWRGIRNRKLLLQNSSPVTKKEVSEIYKELFPQRRQTRFKPEPPPRLYTLKDLRSERAWVEARGKTDWASHKQSEAKTQKRISDKNYIRIRNGEKLRSDTHDCAF